jgi:hypothetical protein
MTPNVRGQQYSHANIGKIRIHLLRNTDLFKSPIRNGEAHQRKILKERSFIQQMYQRITIKLCIKGGPPNCTPEKS